MLLDEKVLGFHFRFFVFPTTKTKSKVNGSDLEVKGIPSSIDEMADLWQPIA
jgi:hypothetical protein